jgi:cbb3-type cytochrome oxidase cytochrome c subunit
MASNSTVGSQQPVLIEPTGELYPAGRSGLAREGAQVYRSLGCAECHSQQVRQSGLEFEVWLTDAGTNAPAVINAIEQARAALKENSAAMPLNDLPARAFTTQTISVAEAAVKRLTDLGAGAQLVRKDTGPDIQRGWGHRLTMAQDFLRDDPVQIGSQRIGPDLANYGTRQTNALLILQHLYDPQKTMPGSMMPPYRFLFTTRKLSEGEAVSPGALPAAFVPGVEVKPRPEALALVAYLNSLKADAPLTNAPYDLPPVKAAAAPPPPVP